MKSTALATALVLAATGALAEPKTYSLDPSHSQILFSYDHFGFSTTWGMFSGFGGDIVFDAEDPAASSVSVSMPVKSMFTGWEAREGYFMGNQFFDASDDEMVSFTSTDIEVTGETTAIITGDLTLNGITKKVALDAQLNKAGINPMSNTDWLGFDAKTTLLRSDYGLGAFAPAVGDTVTVLISIEAGLAQ